MNRNTRLLSLAPAACIFATAAASSVASPLQVRGMTSVWSIALSAADTTPVNGMIDPTLLKLPTSQGSAPAAWAPVTNLGNPTLALPDYSSAALFGDDKDIIEVDALSGGADFVPAPDLMGAPRVDSQFDNWLVYVVSVKDGAVGAPGGHINSINGIRPAGAELIGFYASGSQNIDASLPGTTTVEHSAYSLGYTGTTSGTDDIDGLDYGIGVNTVAPSSMPSPFLFPNLESFYFSISRDTVTAWNTEHNNAPFATYQGAGRAASPGDVYVKYWLGSKWSSTEVYRRGVEDLNLLPGENLDALSVSYYTGVVIFSTEMNVEGFTNRPQLLINSADVELHDKHPDGTYTKVMKKLDLADETDDVDGLCGIDPEGANYYDSSVGIPITSTANTTNPVYLPVAGKPLMGLSLQRGVLAAGGQNHLSVQLSGWGDDGDSAGSVYLFTCLPPTRIPPNVDPFSKYPDPDNSSVLITPVWTLLGPFPRGATQDQWELSVPFDPPVVGQHMAVAAAYNVGGEWVAGSLVTQFVW